jgi:NADH:ubiquinone oxidoreductase subunit 6 (subunit J)
MVLAPPDVVEGLCGSVAALLQLHAAECSSMTNFVVYLIGTLLVVAGLAYGASRLGVSQVWIIAGALVIIGIGVMGGIVKTRQKEPS